MSLRFDIKLEFFDCWSSRPVRQCLSVADAPMRQTADKPTDWLTLQISKAKFRFARKFRQSTKPTTMSTNGTHGVHSTSIPPPTSAIDWNQVGFQVHKVNGHAHATWTNGKWSAAEFRTDEYLHIHGFASCLNYGQVLLSLSLEY